MPLNDPLSIQFINCFQGGFPLVEKPFLEVANQLGTTQDKLLSLIENLLNEGWLSRFGPLFDAQQLGGGLTLAAISVPQHRYQEVTEIVNGFSQVAHNYRREHALNMWFVVGTENTSGINETIASIEQRTGLKVYNCPKIQEFYVGLQLLLDETGKVDTVPLDTEHCKPINTASDSLDLSEMDRSIIKATQSGLPLIEKPFHLIAEQLDTDAENIISRMQQMKQSGIMRRMGAVPNHYKLGLRGNGMTVWNVPDDRVTEIGEKIGRMGFVSHCYQRPRHLPDWPYNVFAMVHGATKELAADKVKILEAELAPDVFDHETLFSSAILKKTGLRL